MTLQINVVVERPIKTTANITNLTEVISLLSNLHFSLYLFFGNKISGNSRALLAQANSLQRSQR